MTEEEADEVLHTAMTVGATRMQVMLTQETAKLGASPDTAAAAVFSAAEVVEQTDGG